MDERKRKRAAAGRLRYRLRGGDAREERRQRRAENALAANATQRAYREATVRFFSEVENPGDLWRNRAVALDSECGNRSHTNVSLLCSHAHTKSIVLYVQYCVDVVLLVNQCLSVDSRTSVVV